MLPLGDGLQTEFEFPSFPVLQSGQDESCEEGYDARNRTETADDEGREPFDETGVQVVAEDRDEEPDRQQDEDERDDPEELERHDL